MHLYSPFVLPVRLSVQKQFVNERELNPVIGPDRHHAATNVVSER
jgi:hypothetical protein